MAKQTYFMPISLVIMGCMARATAWMLPMQEVLADTYAVLDGWQRLALQAATAPPGGWALPPYHALLPPCLSIAEEPLGSLELEQAPAPRTRPRAALSDDEEEGDVDSAASPVEQEAVVVPALNFFASVPASSSAPSPAPAPAPAPERPAAPARKKRRSGGDEIDDIFGC